jgi:hypothetical protein
MIVDRKYKGIAKVASTDQCRYVINGLHIVRTGEETGYIEATDGRRLVRVPAEFDKQELFPAVGKDCIIPKELFLQAVKDTKPAILGIIIVLNEKTAKTMGYVEMPYIEGTYPQTDHVIPDVKYRKRLAILTFNPQFVAELAAALGTDSDGTPTASIVFDPDDNGAPLIIAGRDANELAILMPRKGERIVLYKCKTPIPVEVCGSCIIDNPLRVAPPATAPAPAPEVAP